MPRMLFERNVFGFMSIVSIDYGVMWYLSLLLLSAFAFPELI